MISKVTDTKRKTISISTGFFVVFLRYYRDVKLRDYSALTECFLNLLMATLKVFATRRFCRITDCSFKVIPQDAGEGSCIILNQSLILYNKKEYTKLTASLKSKALSLKSILAFSDSRLKTFDSGLKR